MSRTSLTIFLDGNISFQTVEILDTILDDDQTDFYRIETARDIIINIEGSVHFNTFYLNRNNRK